MKIDPNLAKVGRIALRAEGENWNAYFAQPDTMEGALYLGSIRLTLVEREPSKLAFIQLMRMAVSDIMFDTLGVRPQWPEPPQPAPEHERTRA
jgi:hypothetical protein